MGTLDDFFLVFITDQYDLFNHMLMMVLQVVVKFIKKAKVLKDCWLEDEDLGRVPLEVSLLTKLNHPSIVSVSTKDSCHFLS